MSALNSSSAVCLRTRALDVALNSLAVVGGHLLISDCAVDALRFFGNLVCHGRRLARILLSQDACVPGFGCGLARESVGGVGFEVGL